MSKKILLNFLLLLALKSAYGQRFNTVEKIVIPPEGSRTVSITTQLYKPLEEIKGAFIMYHQAGSSRGEYIETAQRLNRLGYLCLAVDLRSGKDMNGIENETYNDAKSKMKDTGYLDAYTDMKVSLVYFKGFIKGAYENKADLPLYVIGSSYSASLSCRLATEFKSNVDALFLFSPGEYFVNFNGDEQYIAGFLRKIDAPVWATSSKNETTRLSKLLESVPDTVRLVQFEPTSSGQHGAKALWPQFTDSEDYWESFLSFVNTLP